MNTYDCGETYDSNFPATEPEQVKDEWDEIAAQLDYWALLDAEYWRHRRENEYQLFLERKYGAAWTL